MACFLRKSAIFNIWALLNPHVGNKAHVIYYIFKTIIYYTHMKPYLEAHMF